MFATMSTSATVAPRARVAPAPRRVARAAPLSSRAAHSRNGASRLAWTPRLSLSRSRAAVVRAAGEDKPPLPKETFSNATKMRSEAQAPFRVARMFLFGAFGAMAAFSAINAEPEWNPAGVAFRSLQMLALGSALAWIAGLPTLGAEHVVSNLGHSVAFTAGAAMAYFGGAPLFVSVRDAPGGGKAGLGKNPGGKLRLTDALEGKKDKTYVGLGVASGLLALESVFVLVQRTLADGP